MRNVKCDMCGKEIEMILFPKSCFNPITEPYLNINYNENGKNFKLQVNGADLCPECLLKIIIIKGQVKSNIRPTPKNINVIRLYCLVTLYQFLRTLSNPHHHCKRKIVKNRHSPIDKME